MDVLSTVDLLRFDPSKYDHATGDVEYSNPPVAVDPTVDRGYADGTLAVNPVNDHLFTVNKVEVTELTAASEGNSFAGAVIRENYLGTNELNNQAYSLAIDAVRNRLYVTDYNEAPVNPGSKLVVKVFEHVTSQEEEELEKEEELEEEKLEKLKKEKEEETGEPYPPGNPIFRSRYKLQFTIDGAFTSAGKFTSMPVKFAGAADESNGHVFVGDLGASKKLVYELDENGNLVSTIPSSFQFADTNTETVEIAIDDGATSPTKGYLFVPSGTSPGRSFAFEPYRPPEPPIVEDLSASGITDGEAILRGKVNPNNSETTYRFEYTSEQSFQAEGFEGALVVGEGTVGNSFEGIDVSANAGGLEAGTAYHVRLVADSAEGKDEAEDSFTTYLPPSVSSDCPNQSLRTGPSSLLPDCRAYELVTPANTNGHPPYGQETTSAELFPTRLASASGDAMSFQIGGGSLPGMDATGSYVGDAYLATRSGDGWHTEVAGPGPSFAPSIIPGSPSPDQSHFLWRADPFGPAAFEGNTTSYVRFPDGHSEVLGQGSLGVDPAARGVLISENGTHIVFQTTSENSAVQLESDAAPSGTSAVYDRTLDGSTHVISLLPGDVPLSAGQLALLAGAPAHGEGGALRVNNQTPYLRRDTAQTYEIGENLVFAGVSEGGRRIFYVKGGDLFAFDTESEETVPFTETDDATVVNISADGSAAYFISAQALGVEPSPSGEVPQPGAENLYLSREGALSFVGTVTQRDVDGFFGITRQVHGLGLWTVAMNDSPQGSVAIDPSRSTSDGGVLLFESQAALTEYDPQGHTEIYRYDAAQNSLRCLSCNPTGISNGDAWLQSTDLDEAWLTYWNPVANLSLDAKRAVFESDEALVMNDTDGLRDVYQWEEEGTGDCPESGGCVRLISSGASGRDDYLYAASASGDDVFFRTSDLLLGADPDETPSIYDARVGGGVAPPQGTAGECLGEACQPATSAPADPTPGSSAFHGAGNVKGAPDRKGRCPKGKKRRAGPRSRCVAKKKHHRRKSAAAKGRAHR
jgi:hypothetical protein